MQLNQSEERNAVEAFAVAAPEATTAIPNLRAAGLSFLQIFQLIATYGPALWALVVKGGEWFKSVIDAIKDGKPLPPLPTA